MLSGPRAFLIALLLALALANVPPPPAWGAWRPYGSGIATGANIQDQVSGVTDLAGGMIIAWRDQRTDVGDIYVQRLSGAGDELWAPGGIPVCTAASLQQLPQIVPDDQGGAILVWQDNRADPKGDIYAQRVSGNGAMLWFPNGVSVCAGPSANDETVSRFRAIRDGFGGAIVTFSDDRNRLLVSEPGISKIWAQRITSAGSPYWSPGGLPVAAEPGITYDNAAPASDGLGGAIVAWQDLTSGDWDIAAQHIGHTGTWNWGAPAAICTSAGRQYLPDIVPDGGGGAIIAWVDHRGDPSGDIYAQRVDSSGVSLWSPDGNALVFGPSSNSVGDYVIRMTPGPEGGATLAFADDRKESGVPDVGFTKVWAQRVDINGTPQWGNGVPVDGSAGTHVRPVIMTDTDGGVIVVWQKTLSGTGTNIFAQRLTGFGSALWGPGVNLCNELAPQISPAAIADGLGGVLAAWSDQRADNGDVYANKIDFAGVPGASSRWQCASYQIDGVQATAAVNAQTEVSSAPDGAGGTFITWRDQRSDAGDIYAQHVNSAGTPLWGDGVPICTASALQQQPRIVSDGSEAPSSRGRTTEPTRAGTCMRNGWTFSEPRCGAPMGTP